MKKRIITAVLGLMLVSSSTSADNVYTGGSSFTKTVNEISYTDMGYLPVDNWSNTAVFTVSALGIMNGFEGNFDPYSEITAVEAMAILFRCAGLETQAGQLWSVVAGQKAQNPDAYNNIASWADGYMRLAVDKKLITVEQYMQSMDVAYTQIENPLFKKESPLLKSELIKWTVKAFDIPLAEKENEILAFSDADTFKQEDRLYFETALRHGIVKGSGDTLAPYVTLTREQAAQIFFNIRDIWLPLCGISIHHGTVAEVEEITTEGEDMIERTQTIKTDSFDITSHRQYRMNGEEVDYTVYDDMKYTDTVVISPNSLPQDTSCINKSDNITCYTKNGEAILILKEIGVSEGADFNPDEYTDGEVYSGKLYLFDTEERQIILETENGFKEIPYIRDVSVKVRTKDIDKEIINTEYADKTVYVFTAVKTGGSGERAYMMQIIE
jgi:hypothetical protein